MSYSKITVVEVAPRCVPGAVMDHELPLTAEVTVHKVWVLAADRERVEVLEKVLQFNPGDKMVNIDLDIDKSQQLEDYH